ncbi:MAG: hypothetical protein KME22_15510 [Hassallia sp. WJT32-NPBG1]|nr:hypothetical protein [Hassallia sp. WJT32-NPBG1]
MNFQTFGACEQKFINHVRKLEPDEMVAIAPLLLPLLPHFPAADCATPRQLLISQGGMAQYGSVKAMQCLE